MLENNKKIILFALVISIVAVLAIYGIRTKVTPTDDNNQKVVITTTSGNYGLFIDTIDNNYFSTNDSNVRNLIKTYLVSLNGKTDAEKYGHSLIFYYDSSRFIEAYSTMPNNDSTIFYYTLYNTKNGQKVPGCTILKPAGFYKDENFLLSASFFEEKQGLCMYEKGSSNFNFIDLSSKLAENETLFKDPAGQLMTASVTNVDTKNRTLNVGVYSKNKKDSSGNYIISRSMNVSF